MKPSFVFALVMLTAIVMITVFNLQFAPGTPLVVAPDKLGQVLFLCPVTSQSWDSVKDALQPISHYFTIGFFSTGMILMFVWGWALYQNLLKDKFDKKAFSNPWNFTKLWMWALVIFILASASPNHFKTVRVAGSDQKWILCEQDTPGAHVEHMNKVQIW